MKFTQMNEEEIGLYINSSWWLTLLELQDFRKSLNQYISVSLEAEVVSTESKRHERW